MWYILKYKKPILATSDEYTKWYKKNPKQRIIKQEIVNNHKISTVFLGLDHRYNEDVSILWETMIFGKNYEDYQERYSSHKDAVIGHKKAAKIVLNE